MPKITDPIQIGKLALRNRYVKAPTVCGHATEEGYVSDRLLDLYEAEARGGVGLVICHASYIRSDGQGFRCQMGNYDDKCINGLNRLAEAIQGAGARAAIQIFHAGAIAQPKIIGGRTPVSPSSIPLFLDPTQKTRSLEDEEVDDLARLFGVACARAKEAGFDAVEIHACHGSLIQQFLSPSFNHRSDRWGQDRLLFPRRVIQEVRKAVGPDYPLLWRISAEEFIGVKGFTLKDTVETFLPAYLQEGIDCVDVSAGGIMGTESLCATIPPLYYPHGTNVPFATEIKKVTSLPVIGVAKIMEPQLAAKLVEDGKLDLVALCRPMMSDPEYPRKAFEGRTDEIRKCIGCNYCIARLTRRQVGAKCAVNPDYGARDPYQLIPAGKPKRVLIVGGGVGGMECGRVATLRGHQVTLCEAENTLGGMVNAASGHPRLFTRDLQHIVEYLSTMIKKLNVKVELGKRATAEEVVAGGYDAVVIATGSRPKPSSIPGIEQSHVVANEVYLKRKPPLGQKVVVLGGHEGAETAISLAREGKEVTLIEEGNGVGTPSYIVDGLRTLLVLEYLEKDKVRILTGAKVQEITGQGVRVARSDGAQQLVEADHVIMALGRQADEDLYQALIGKVKELHRIGDCVTPRSIAEAVHEGNHLAKRL